MKAQHLSDENIQEYVLRKSNEQSVTDHVQGCEVCRAKVEVYQHIITGIKEQAHAEFDFNLAETVMIKIEQNDAANFNVFWLVAILVIGVMLVAIISFGRYITHLFSGISEMASYLVVTTAVAILLFQGGEILRKYKRQMDTINFG